MTDEERERMIHEILVEADTIADKYLLGKDTEESTIDRMKEEIVQAAEGLYPHTKAIVSSWRAENGEVQFIVIVSPHIIPIKRGGENVQGTQERT